MARMSSGAREEAGEAERQRLLDDHADDGAVGRADQLQRRDLPDLLHGHGVDDERDDHGRDEQQDRHEQADLAARAVDHGLREDRLLLGLRHGGEMLPPPRRLGDSFGRHIRVQPRDHGIDRVPARSARAARQLHARRRRRQIELQLLGIEQRDVDDGIAARGDLLPRSGRRRGSGCGRGRCGRRGRGRCAGRPPSRSGCARCRGPR